MWRVVIYLVRSSHLPPFVAPNVVTGELFGRSGSRTTPPASASASARARRRNCPFLSDSQTDMHNILELVHRVGDGGNISRLLIPGSIKISCIKLAAVIENSKLIVPQLRSPNSESTKGQREGANVKLTFVPSRVLSSAAPFVIQLFNQCQTLSLSLPPSLPLFLSD